MLVFLIVVNNTPDDIGVRLFQVAIKMINTQKVTEEFRSKFLPREIECWKRLNHPHLVRILGHYEAMQHVFLTMEFARGGDMVSLHRLRDANSCHGRQMLAGKIKWF